MLLVLVVVTASIACWVLAASGLLRIPLFSSLAYQPPVPVTVVRAGVPAETSLLTQLTNAAALGETYPVLVVSEESLTASFRSLVEEAGVSLVRTEDVQVASVEGKGLELFFPVRNNAQSTAVRAVLVVEVNESHLTASVTEVTLGSLPLPSWLVAATVDALISGVLTRLEESMPEGATISSVTYEAHAARVGLELSVAPSL